MGGATDRARARLLRPREAHALLALWTALDGALGRGLQVGLHHRPAGNDGGLAPGPGLLVSGPQGIPILILGLREVSLDEGGTGAVTLDAWPGGRASIGPTGPRLRVEFRSFEPRSVGELVDSIDRAAMTLLS